MILTDGIMVSMMSMIRVNMARIYQYSMEFVGPGAPLPVDRWSIIRSTKNTSQMENNLRANVKVIADAHMGSLSTTIK